MSFEKAIVEGIARLRHKGIAIDDGLSDVEISRIEARFQFMFPPDLRFFLQMAMPLSPYFVNWRTDPEKLETWFAPLTEGVLFDVQNNVFWHADWGERPVDTFTAIQIAKHHLADVPKLIPIGDRVFTKCVPAAPSAAGNPVFSVHQTDILHAGRDLGDFLQWFSRPKESFERDEEEGTEPTPLYCDDYRSITFWTELVRRNVMS